MAPAEYLTKATRSTRRRYDRNAPMYDMMEHLMETRAFERWRSRLWGLVEGLTREPACSGLGPFTFVAPIVGTSRVSHFNRTDQPNEMRRAIPGSSRRV